MGLIRYGFMRSTRSIVCPNMKVTWNVKVRSTCMLLITSKSINVVLRIFGIYTHAQLDRRFWDYVGFQLGRKGKDYKTRYVRIAIIIVSR